VQGSITDNIYYGTSKIILQDQEINCKSITITWGAHEGNIVLPGVSRVLPKCAIPLLFPRTPLFNLGYIPLRIDLYTSQAAPRSNLFITIVSYQDGQAKTLAEHDDEFAEATLAALEKHRFGTKRV
jgi:hypothetical protein